MQKALVRLSKFRIGPLAVRAGLVSSQVPPAEPVACWTLRLGRSKRHVYAYAGKAGIPLPIDQSVDAIVDPLVGRSLLVS